MGKLVSGWQHMDEVGKILEKLPVHTPEQRNDHRAYVLCVDGLVRKPLNLRLADLKEMHQQDFTHDFACLEGWTVPDVRWRGVLLETVLLLAEPSEEARYVQASAGEFSLSLGREIAAHALLAISLGDTAVPPEHGAPVRLLFQAETAS